MFEIITEVKLLVSTCNLTDLEIQYKAICEKRDADFEFNNCVKHFERFEQHMINTWKTERHCIDVNNRLMIAR